MRTLLVAAFALWSVAASSATLLPDDEDWFTIDEDTAALVSYTVDLDGITMFAIVEQRGEVWPTRTLQRATLRQGQSKEITVEKLDGQLSPGLLVTYDGPSVRIEPMPGAVVQR